MRRGRLVPSALAGALAGTAVVGTVCAAKLVGARFDGDLHVMCEAERLSGKRFDEDVAGVSQGVRDRLSTREGGAFWSSLRDLPLEARGPALRSRAETEGIATCPMADAFERSTREAAERRDLARLCSLTTFPALAELDDGARLQWVEEWMDGEPTTSAAQGVSDALASAPDATARASLLREASRAVGLRSCDLARELTAPRVLSCAP